MANLMNLMNVVNSPNSRAGNKTIHLTRQEGPFASSEYGKFDDEFHYFLKVNSAEKKIFNSNIITIESKFMKSKKNSLTTP